MPDFKLNDSEFIPLNDLLKVMRLVGTGGEANIRIVSGEVQVNGEVELRKRRKLRPGDVVSFDEEEIVIRR